MQISVILSNYNGSRYLKEAIMSVLDQDFEDFEFILVDDCSTDSSRNLIRKLARNDKRIVPIFHEVNKGQAAGFNTGFQASSGKWIAFLDSDDLWKPSKLSFVKREFEHSPETALLQHSLHILSGEEKTQTPFKPGLLCGDLLEWNKQNPNRLPWFVPTSGLAVARSAYQFIGKIPDSFRICADGFLTRTTMCHGMVKASSEAHGYYRCHEKNNVAENASFDTNGYINNLLKPELNTFYLNKGIDLILK